MADNVPDGLEARLEQWEADLGAVMGRLERIEQRLNIAPVPLPPQPRPVGPWWRAAWEENIFDAPPPGPETAPAPALETPPSPSGEAGASAPAAPPSRRDWEGIVGGRWALWVGTLAVFLSVAFFLAYAWSHLGPWMRLGIGCAAGAALLACGEWARGKTERGYGAALTGGGLAVMYLDVWAAAHVYRVAPYNVSLALMVLIAVAGVGLALLHDAVSLSALAAVGGFLTPALLDAGSGGSGGMMLFAYVAVLDAGLAVVAVTKRWQGISWLSFAATVILLGGWASDHYSEAQRWPVFAWITVLFLLFVVAAAWDGLQRDEETTGNNVLLLFSDALAYAVAGFAVLEGVLHPHPGVFPLAMAAFFGLMAPCVRSLAPKDTMLRDTATALALLFLTAAVPIELREGWLALAWTIEAAALLTLAARSSNPLLRKASNIVWLLSVVVVYGIVSTVDPARHVILLNERALPLLASAVATAWMATVSRKHPVAGDALTPVYAPTALVAGAWLIAQETWAGFAWSHNGMVGAGMGAPGFRTAALWALYALAAYAVGVEARERRVRLTALLVAVMAALLTVGTQSLADAAGGPFWNARWMAFVTVTAALGGIIVLARRSDAPDAGERDLNALLPMGLLGFALWGLTAETYETVRWNRAAFGPEWERAAHLAVSLLWTVCATALLVAGATLRRRPLRLFALALFGLTVCKVFFADLGFLEGATRVLSFGGLGVALLGISWLYSRYGVGREGAPTAQTEA